MQPRVFGRVVLQVGVLHDHDVAGGVAEALAQGRPLALIARLVDHAQIAVGLHFLQNAPRAVRAAIIDQDDLFRNVHGPHAAHHLADPALLVVNRDDDRELEPGRHRIDAELTAGRLAEQAVQQGQPFRRTPRFQKGEGFHDVAVRAVGGMAVRAVGAVDAVGVKDHPGISPPGPRGGPPSRGRIIERRPCRGQAEYGGLDIRTGRTYRLLPDQPAARARASVTSLARAAGGP